MSDRRMKAYEHRAALEVLDHVTEFRFVYFTDRVSRHYTVKRDLDHRSDWWGVFDGGGAWDGETWVPNAGFPDSFRWDLEDAVKIAQKLAFEENQRLIAIMERDYPGQFKGTSQDFMATHTGAPESRAPGRHLVVSPEPLKIVKAKAGGKSPEPEYLFARRWHKDRLRAASIHRDSCKRVPEDGRQLRDGSHWTVDKIPQSKVNSSYAWAADKGVEASVSCSSCRGWSIT